MNKRGIFAFLVIGILVISLAQDASANFIGDIYNDAKQNTRNALASGGTGAVVGGVIGGVIAGSFSLGMGIPIGVAIGASVGGAASLAYSHFTGLLKNGSIGTNLAIGVLIGGPAGALGVGAASLIPGWGPAEKLVGARAAASVMAKQGVKGAATKQGVKEMAIPALKKAVKVALSPAAKAKAIGTGVVLGLGAVALVKPDLERYLGTAADARDKAQKELPPSKIPEQPETAQPPISGLYTSPEGGSGIVWTTPSGEPGGLPGIHAKYEPGIPGPLPPVQPAQQRQQQAESGFGAPQQVAGGKLPEQEKSQNDWDAGKYYLKYPRATPTARNLLSQLAKAKFERQARASAIQRAGGGVINTVKNHIPGFAPAAGPSVGGAGAEIKPGAPGTAVTTPTTGAPEKPIAQTPTGTGGGAGTGGGGTGGGGTGGGIAPGCGNGQCDAGETADSCPSDCSNLACTPEWTCTTTECSAEGKQTKTCTDSACGNADTAEELDCGQVVTQRPVCGDGICDITEMETCPQDCGQQLAPTCGDYICDLTETFETCPEDCYEIAAPTRPTAVIAGLGIGIVALGVVLGLLIRRYSKLQKAGKGNNGARENPVKSYLTHLFKR